jgi:hypothetical protein
MKNRMIHRLILTAMLAFGSALYGQTSNAIPYQETFEGMAVGSSILVAGNTNGWYGNATLAVATNLSYTWTNGRYPVESATHTKVLQYSDASLTNRFAPHAEANMTVDLMIQPAMGMPDTNLVAGTQTAFYVDTNGLVNVWYGIDNSGTNNTWLTYTNTPVGTADWARVTIALDYATDASNSYFKVTLDGVELQPPTNGFSKGFGVFNADTNGTWLLIANPSSRNIQSFAINGSGLLDDLVVTTSAVTNFFSLAAQPYTLTVNSGSGGNSYTSGAQVVISANAPASGYAFDKWTGDTQYVVSASSASTTVTMPARDVALTATYKFSEQYTTNGTPYSWLTRHGLTNYEADAVLDQDGDSLKTWQEYIAGTDPTNDASCLKISQATRDAITWTAQSGRVYSVYWSTNLVSGFTSLNADISYPQSSYTNMNPDSRINHYQLKVRME